MAGFGDVLRGLGSVLNPQVMQAVEAEQGQDRSLQKQVGMMMLQKQLAEQGPEYQAKLEALKNEKGYREAVSALDPNAADYQDRIAAAANQFGKPEVAAAYAKSKEDRALRIQTAAENLQLRRDQLDQQRDLALQRATDQRERDRISAEFKAQSLALQGQIASANQEMRRLGLDVQRQKIDSVANQQLTRQTSQLQAALEKANLPEADSVLGAVEEAIKKAPELGDWLTGLKGQAPDMVVPDNIKAGRQAFQKLFNITLKNRSGAAVTIPEFERLKAEFGSGLFKTPEQIQNALTQARNILNKHYASVASGFGKDALDSYNENVRQFGGRVVIDGAHTAASPAPAPNPSPKPNGKVKFLGFE